MGDLLDKLGWSQAYFAKRVGVTEQTVGRWVRGDPPRLAVVYLEQCCRLLGV